jgi:hypothetical protein
MKIEIKLAETHKLVDTVPEEVVTGFLQLSSEELTGAIKKETPVRYGKLRGSWTPKLSKNKLTVTNSRKYAVFVEKGTGIFGPRRHRIFPAKAKAMKATINGETRFFTNQRGMAGRHMAEKGLMQYRKRIPTLFRTSFMRHTGGK